MKKELIRPLFAFDTEDDGRGVPYLWNFYSVATGQHFTFFNIDRALDFVCELPWNAEVWACNLEYDLANTFREHYGMLEQMYSGSKLIRAEVIGSKVVFLDTLNHWKMGVAEMGLYIGLPKLHMKHRKGVKTVSQKTIDYCRRDTEIVGKFVGAMREEYDSIGARIKSTIAASSLELLEDYLDYKIRHPFTEDQIDFFHEGYYGGRTEIFFNKPIGGRIFYSDKNSLYPACMAKYPFPLLESMEETKTPDFDLCGMSHVRVKAPELEIPYLPHRRDGKLYFPLGEWEGVYTHFEIKAALKLGYQIGDVKRTIQFRSNDRPFTRFVTDLYSERLRAFEQGNHIRALVLKQILNYSYGKFAQRNVVTRYTPLHEAGKLKHGDQILADLVLRQEKVDYPRYAGCVWAAYITAYGRHEIYHGIQRVIQGGGFLIYTDTDSLIYEAPAPILEDSRDLGAFKFVGEWKKAFFKLPKLYALEGQKSKFEADLPPEYKAKGVPSHVAKQFFTRGSTSFQRPNRFREVLRRSAQLKAPKLIPNYWQDQEKTVLKKYDKRRVLSDGTTAPLVFERVVQ